MSTVQRYLAYAEAFEETYADDDWSRLEQYFTDDAVMSPDGTAESEARGQADVLARLKTGVDTFDRRMDSRTLEFLDGPAEAGGRVSCRWKATYTKAGLPDLVITGAEHATFDGERIARLEDEFDADAQAGLEAWMGEHGAALSGD